MLDLLLMAFLSYRNGMRAKAKEQNPFLWGLITFFAYIAGMFIGVMVVVLGFCRDTINLDQFSSLDQKSRNVAAQQMLQVFSANPLHVVTIELFGIGGYLLIRYILDKKPGKKGPEVHWMDKLGDNNI